jgi:hypothetical protein
MPDEKQEKAVAAVFLRHFNAAHATQFRIRGRPERDTKGAVPLDFCAVCRRSGDEMLIEVGEAGSLQNAFAQHVKWQDEFQDCAAKMTGLPPGRWDVGFHPKPPDPPQGFSAGQWRRFRHRFIQSILGELASHLPTPADQCVEVDLTQTRARFPEAGALRAWVSLVAAQPHLQISVDWGAGGWFSPKDELLKSKVGSIVDEAHRKFASSPKGAERVLVLWSQTLPTAFVAEMSDTTEFLAREAPGRNLDGIYFIEWHGVAARPSLREIFTTPYTMWPIETGLNLPWRRRLWNATKRPAVLSATALKATLFRRPRAQVTLLWEKEDRE